MSLQVTTLVENTQGEHLALKNEHGLSFYIEKDGHKLLFDTGQSDAFLYNADQMKIDLTDLEYGDTTLKEIERWLTAHFLSARDPRIASEKAGKSEWKYDGKTGLGLQSSKYGQQAMLLDHKGKLAQIDQAKRAAEIITLDEDA